MWIKLSTESYSYYCNLDHVRRVEARAGNTPGSKVVYTSRDYILVLEPLDDVIAAINALSSPQNQTERPSSLRTAVADGVHQYFATYPAQQSASASQLLNYMEDVKFIAHKSRKTAGKYLAEFTALTKVNGRYQLNAAPPPESNNA